MTERHIPGRKPEQQPFGGGVNRPELHPPKTAHGPSGGNQALREQAPTAPWHNLSTDDVTDHDAIEDKQLDKMRRLVVSLLAVSAAAETIRTGVDFANGDNAVAIVDATQAAWFAAFAVVFGKSKISK